jgi:phosphatidylserine decarboxylase
MAIAFATRNNNVQLFTFINHMKEYQPIVEQLRQLLQVNTHLKNALEESLHSAAEKGLGSPEEFYDFLDSILTHIPSEKELMPSVRRFYFVLSQSPGDILRNDPAFNAWMNRFVSERGNFMDTTASTDTLQSFIDNPEYKIDDYIKGPSGWLTYNQFLARQLKPGKRPIAGRCDNCIIVSPADSEFKGQWPVTDASSVVVKGTTYNISSLLEGSDYKNKFDGGIFTHSFLSITDYHRFHTPVAGIIREVKNTAARTWVNEARKADGELENIDDVGFQFTHTRGHIIIESPNGLVAVMPVGMGHISSVILNAETGTRLEKGEEFGYFAFGGSDIIMLFEPGKVELSAQENKHYKMGEAIGRYL